jgi:hypothetical protein
VSSISGEVVLARITRTREGCFEQRQSAFGIAAGAQLPATLEVDAHLRDGARSGLRFRLLEQAIASVEVVPQTLDSCELCEHLGAPGIL